MSDKTGAIIIRFDTFEICLLQPELKKETHFRVGLGVVKDLFEKGLQ